jgi:predicted Zn-dependent peptidase
MSRMAKSQLLRGRIHSPDDIIERIDAVKEDQLMELGRELLTRERLSLALVGPIEAPPSW